MKQSFTLTSSNDSVVIHGNVPTNKVISIRKVFARGFGIGVTSLTKKVNLQYVGDGTGGVGSLDVNDYQIQTDDFSYPLVAGAEMRAFVTGLAGEQSIYVEIDYEILDAQ